MITPIMVYSPPQRSFEDRLLSAAVDYSSDPSQQKAFMDGAKWATGGDSGLAIFLTIVIGLFLMFQVAAGVIGMMNGNDGYSQRMTNKYKYVFPAYNIGYDISKWMSKEERK